MRKRIVMTVYLAARKDARPLTALEGALYMATVHGLPVFRVNPNGKDPYRSGVHEATRDLERIKDWFAATPDLNYGVALPGHLVLDVDTKEPGAVGFENLLLLQDECRLPRTLRVRSASGGFHLFFAGHECSQADVQHPKFELRKCHKTGRLLSDINVRSTASGYVVGPGSVIDGRRYEVIDPAPIAPCPESLTPFLGTKAEKPSEPQAWLCEPDDPTNVAVAVLWLQARAPAVEKCGGDAWTLATATGLKDRGISEELAYELMLEHWNPRCLPEWDPEDLRTKVRNAYAYMTELAPGAKAVTVEFDVLPDPNPLVLDPRDPMPSARKLIARDYTRDGLPTLLHRADDFFSWTGTHYARTDSGSITAAVWRFLEEAKRRDKGETEVPFQPTTARVSDVCNALKAICNVDGRLEPPAWLAGHDHERPPANELLPCRNGLLHLPTRKLYALTPAFFGLNALPYNYEPSTAAPKKWLRFLHSLWPDDPEAVVCLQQWFGLMLSGDTRHHKMLLIVGPPRSGKGTIGRVLTAMLGPENVAGPTLSSLAGPFGLEPLLGKMLAIVSDARIGGKADRNVIAERLLAVSGEDTLTVDRKHRAAWHGRLSTRFMLLTNELPQIFDASGALASRFIVLTMTESFLGKEDKGLTGRLLAELPAILNWSLAGLDDLQKRGRLLQPDSSDDAIRELADLASPISAFVRERCVVGPRETIECDALFQAWLEWAMESGHGAGTKATFGKNLKAAFPAVKRTQPRDGDNRVPHYAGIGLRDPLP
jgi:putative DNA primase/helicase